MMIIVSRQGDSITGSCNGVPYGVSYDEKRFKTMKDLARQATYATSIEELKAIVEDFKPLMTESYKELAETRCPYIYVNKGTGKFYLKLGDTISTKAIPQAFVDRILISIDKNIEFLPLIKAWVRFLRNPNFSDKKAVLFANYLNNTYTDQVYKKELIDSGLSELVAHERATRYQTPVTEEGLLVTYKVSREILTKFALDENGRVKQSHRWKATVDENTGIVSYQEPPYVEERVFQPAIMGNGGDAFTCHGAYGHIIKVGSEHALESWDQVNTKDYVFGDKGLHCGNLNYIRGYQTEGTVTHNVFIDPAYIGRFTNEEDGAVVVLKYFVHSSFAGVNKSIYHSSEYAKVTDAEYEQMMAEAIRKTGETTAAKIEADKQFADEAIAISTLPEED